jgi:hypothetical protein
MQTERTQLAQRASSKMRRAIGRVLPGESPEELERMAAQNERAARASSSSGATMGGLGTSTKSS